MCFFFCFVLLFLSSYTPTEALYHVIYTHALLSAIMGYILLPVNSFLPALLLRQTFFYLYIFFIILFRKEKREKRDKKIGATMCQRIANNDALTRLDCFVVFFFSSSPMCYENNLEAKEANEVCLHRNSEITNNNAKERKKREKEDHYLNQFLGFGRRASLPVFLSLLHFEEKKITATISCWLREKESRSFASNVYHETLKRCCGNLFLSFGSVQKTNERQRPNILQLIYNPPASVMN